jgi:hypothetical protein
MFNYKINSTQRTRGIELSTTEREATHSGKGEVRKWKYATGFCISLTNLLRTSRSIIFQLYSHLAITIATSHLPLHIRRGP